MQIGIFSQQIGLGQRQTSGGCFHIDLSAKPFFVADLDFVEEQAVQAVVVFCVFYQLPIAPDIDIGLRCLKSCIFRLVKPLLSGSFQDETAPSQF